MRGDRAALQVTKSDMTWHDMSLDKALEISDHMASRVTSDVTKQGAWHDRSSGCHDILQNIGWQVWFVGSGIHIWTNHILSCGSKTVFFFLKFFKLPKALILSQKINYPFWILQHCNNETWVITEHCKDGCLFVPKNFVPSLQIRLKSGWARKPILAAKAPIFWSCMGFVVIYGSPYLKSLFQLPGLIAAWSRMSFLSGFATPLYCLVAYQQSELPPGCLDG